MPGQGRLGDKASVSLDAHGCPGCPHPAIGPAIQGSSDVNVNRRPALRVGDPGIHTACCGANTWTATKGSLTVFINGRGAHRVGDQNRHCGGMGQLVEGSSNVIVGESSGDSRNSSSREGTRNSGSTGDGRLRAIEGGDEPSSLYAQDGASWLVGASERPAPPSDAHSGSAPSFSGASAASAESDRDSGEGRAAEAAGEVPSLAADPSPIEELTWIEIALSGEDGSPVVGERYVVEIDGGESRTGKLDRDGRAKLQGLRPGEYRINFPDLDADAWTAE